jgi:glucosamine--fructose-6-phosphate aminotransferase (isomerizing)
MCGGVGYIRIREAYPYRYKVEKDWNIEGMIAGVMIYDGDAIKLCKTKGRLWILKLQRKWLLMEQLELVIRVGQHMVF